MVAQPITGGGSDPTLGLAPSRDWRRYYAATGSSPPRATLVHALDRFANEPLTRRRSAVDLGCGSGQDTRELLRRGWRVLAIDSEPEAIRHLQDPSLEHRRRLQTQVASFEIAWWPSADLVNASYALPFCPGAAFSGVWGRILASLKPGGRFAGQLFGNRDSWAAQPDLIVHSRAEVLGLLAGLEIELLREQERDGRTALGQLKHWHVFDIVARKIPAPADERTNPNGRKR